jgi:hypothetical protein
VPQDILTQPFLDRNFVYYGGPEYRRNAFNVTDLLTPGRVYAQVQLTVYELGYAWGWVGDDGYPAPYFDNVQFKAYPIQGPALAAREIDLAQDNFPEIEEIDLVNLENNHVRFDMARDISLGTELYNLPGDSIIVDISPARSGAELVGDPEMVWALQPNPVFNPYRTSVFGTATSGVVPGTVAVGTSGNPTLGTYAFDLPDSNFLFPGDVLHYYIRATDAVDGSDAQETTLPASEIGQAPAGFGDFSHPRTYNSSFTVRALPSLYDSPWGNPGELVQPRILFWNDFANRGGEAEWLWALDYIGLIWPAATTTSTTPTVLPVAWATVWAAAPRASASRVTTSSSTPRVT